MSAVPTCSFETIEFSALSRRPLHTSASEEFDIASRHNFSSPICNNQRGRHRRMTSFVDASAGSDWRWHRLQIKSGCGLIWSANRSCSRELEGQDQCCIWNLTEPVQKIHNSEFDEIYRLNYDNFQHRYDHLHSHCFLTARANVACNVASLKVPYD